MPGVKKGILTDSEKEYRWVLEHANEGIMVVQDAKFVFVNPKAEMITGYTKDELIGMPFVELIHKDEREMVVNRYLRRIKGEITLSNYTIRIMDKKGILKWLDLTAVLFPWKGRPAVFDFITDITERKRAEKRIQESEKRMEILSSQLLTAQEEERKRIARELHDGIGQSLNSIKLGVESACKQSSFEAGKQDNAPLKNIILTVKEAISELRRIIQDLRPSLLDMLGILATLQWLVRKISALCPNITVEISFDIREEEIPENLKTAIYRIVQEAFNNILKHSNGNLIFLELARINDEIQLTVRDNGKGFDLKKMLSLDAMNAGFGIASMKKRVELSKGFFDIESIEGKGTKIRARWPL